MNKKYFLFLTAAFPGNSVYTSVRRRKAFGGKKERSESPLKIQRGAARDPGRGKEEKMKYEMNSDMLSAVNGGKVNKNIDPKSITNWVDSTINGKEYDALAQIIADALNPKQERIRPVNNNVDIYDCAI